MLCIQLEGASELLDSAALDSLLVAYDTTGNPRCACALLRWSSSGCRCAAELQGARIVRGVEDLDWRSYDPPNFTPTHTDTHEHARTHILARFTVKTCSM